MGAKERRERERENRKSQILDTARALLLEKGLNATSINSIARRAELSVGAIYFYYKSKEDLYAALQVEGLELLNQTIRKAVDEASSPLEQVRKIARAYLQFSEENRNYFDILNYFLSSPEPIFSPDLKNQIDEHGKNSLNILIDVISRGVQDGSFKAADPRRQAVILWGTLHGILQFKKLEKTILARENHQSLYLEAVERFLEGQRR